MAWKKAKYGQPRMLLPDGAQCCYSWNRPNGCSGQVKQRDGTLVKCLRTHACLHCGDKDHKLSGYPSFSG